MPAAVPSTGDELVEEGGLGSCPREADSLPEAADSRKTRRKEKNMVLLELKGGRFDLILGVIWEDFLGKLP